MFRIPLAREGWPFIVAFAVPAAIFAFVRWRPAAVAFLALALFVTWFFRDPEREVPRDADAIVSPADGRVTSVDPLPGGGARVSIFLSIFDVHVNRACEGGEVVEVRRERGKFLDARNPEASEKNERVAVTVRTPRGDVRFVQLTGLIARRIVCRLAPGDRVARGQRYGLIRFGSRMDVHLPANARPAVAAGDRVRGGSSVLARWVG